MKPTVLFVHSNSELYGADFILLEVVRALKDQIIPIVAIPGEGDLTLALRDEGVRLVRLGESTLRRVNFKPQRLPGFSLNLIKDIYKLVRLIRSEKIPLVYSNTSAVISGALAARICKIPNIYHIHEIIGSPEWLAKTIARIVLGNSSEVIAVSGPVRDQLYKYGHYGDPFIRVIHNGLDPAPFDKVENVRNAREELGARDGDVLFGVIGRIHPWKGQKYLLDAAKLVCENCPQAKFAIVGGTFAGYEYLIDELTNHIHKSGLENRVKLLSHRRDVPRLMKALDVFVLPSTLPDPLPTVVLEAMAAGKPVVATAHGGALEMVVHGQTGLLAPYQDPEEFANVLMELTGDADKRAGMGRAGRKRLEDCFLRSQFHDNVRLFMTSFLARLNLSETVLSRKAEPV
ncbi:MAG: glycosyltransferase family 4 protein [bacterium]|nr:glycosyltransferase family 4 protein [bacterium]